MLIALYPSPYNENDELKEYDLAGLYDQPWILEMRVLVDDFGREYHLYDIIDSYLSRFLEAVADDSYNNKLILVYGRRYDLEVYFANSTGDCRN